MPTTFERVALAARPIMDPIDRATMFRDAAVMALLHRDGFTPDQVCRITLSSFDAPSRCVHDDGRILHLTRTTVDLLETYAVFERRGADESVYLLDGDQPITHDLVLAIDRAYQDHSCRSPHSPATS
jgi:hypothetical protein